MKSRRSDPVPADSLYSRQGGESRRLFSDQVQGVAPDPGMGTSLGVFVSSTPGGPDCTHVVDTLTCDLGTMAPTDTAVITIDTVLDYPVYGSFSNTETVTAAELDRIQSNNTATVNTVIALFVDGFETGDVTGWD